MFVSILCVFLALFAAQARALCEGQHDGASCGTPTTSTTFLCYGGQCVTFCAEPYVDNNGVCSLSCPSPLIPNLADIISCNTLVNSTCQYECTPPAIRVGGNATRTCLANGQWSGTLINCTLPDPCWTSTCSATSYCVDDKTQPQGYRCDCIADAHGTPGYNGTGCIFPTVSTDNGNIVFTVSDLNDVRFLVGLNRYSARGLDNSINAVGGTVDVKVQAFSSNVMSDYDSDAAAGTNALTQSITQILLTAIDAELSAASSIATADCTAAIDSASIVSSTYAYAAESAAISTMISTSESLSTAVSQSISSSMSSSISTTTSYSVFAANLSTIYSSQSASVASQSTAANATVYSALSTSTQQSTVISSQSASVSSSISILSTYSAIWAAQSATVLNNVSVLTNISTLVAAQSTALSAQILTLLDRSTAWALQSSIVASDSTTNYQTFASNAAMIAQYSTLFAAINTCSLSGTIYNQDTASCVSAALVLSNYVVTSSCTNSSFGQVRLNSATALYCNGSAWVTLGRTPTGLVPSTATPNCTNIVNYQDYTGVGPYWITPASSTIIQQICSSKTNQGGDGLNSTRVALSCATAYTYYGTSGILYISASLSVSGAVPTLCINGTSYGSDGSTAARSSSSCSYLQIYWKFASGSYYINNALTACFMRTVYGCQDAYELVPTMGSGVVTISVLGNSYQAYCLIVGGSAWTMLMKISGSSGTFVYDSPLWSTNATLNTTTGLVGGVDQTEFKSPLYNVLPFNYVRLGMQLGTGSANWMIFHQTAASMYALIAPGTYTNTSLVTNRNAWFALSGAGGLQQYCQQQGFNVYPAANGMRIRIGILGNNVNDCLSCASMIGVGGTGTSCALGSTTSVGYQCSCTCYNAGIDVTVSDSFGSEFAWVMVQ